MTQRSDKLELAFGIIRSGIKVALDDLEAGDTAIAVGTLTTILQAIEALNLEEK